MTQSVFDPVEVLDTVGPKRLEGLHQLGITTVYDLLCHFPFRYEDIQIKSIDEIETESKVSLKGQVVTPPIVSYYGFKKSRLSFRLKIMDAVIQVVFFNQPYLKDKIIVDEELIVFGKYDPLKQSLTGMKIIQQSQADDDFQAIYSVNTQVKQAFIVALIRQALTKYGALIPDLLPQALLEKYQLLSHGQAVQAMHFPEGEEESSQARNTIRFEELFVYAFNIQMLRASQRVNKPQLALLYDNAKLIDWIKSSIPFELTKGQKQVVNEICADLRRPQQMNRLLQGDVGSGKTVVAAVALAATVLSDFQAALMVPTEILAEQHFQSLSELFRDSGMQIALLTGSTKAKDKRVLYEQLAAGEIDIVIGTHALIQADVQFKKLGLAVTDEQHRFGVNQRDTLMAKGPNGEANVLYLTATPIPRTLAISAYGDMDVSILKEMPKGRIPIKTIWTKDSEQDKVYDLIQREITSGRQIYVICPLITESEAVDLKNAEAIYDQYRAHFPTTITMGLLHGQMDSTTKEAVMQAFKVGQIDILVSTTVIEVGMNIPNASAMIIHDAERFGLAQLHQLRGRVGRGQYQSYCILLASPKTEVGKMRMTIMTESTDGFYLAEKDLELRGSGDIFGQRQSGLPLFQYADIIRDQAIFVQATNEAIIFIHDKSWYNSKEATDLMKLWQYKMTTNYEKK